MKNLTAKLLNITRSSEIQNQINKRFSAKFKQKRKPSTPKTNPKSKNPIIECQRGGRRYSYIPSFSNVTSKSNRRIVVIDGCNVAHNHGCHGRFSVRGLETALEFFRREGFEARAIVPEMRKTHPHTDDQHKLLELERNGLVVFTPCKDIPGNRCTSYDDRFILEIAARLDGAVISNDNYRDLTGEDVDWDAAIRNRVIGYMFCDNLFMLPKDPHGPDGPKLYDILFKN